MGSYHGFERPNTARKGIFDFNKMCWSEMGQGCARLTATVSYSSAASNQKYLDKDTGDQVVASGTPKVFAAGLGIQEHDALDASEASFIISGHAKLPIKSTDTPAIGDLLYWDDTAKYLTTTSSGNTKTAICNQAYADWETGDNTDVSALPAISGKKWGFVILQPKA